MFYGDVGVYVILYFVKLGDMLSSSKQVGALDTTNYCV